MGYTFATDRSADKRLEAIAKVFNPHSADFVNQYANKNPVAVADLGCGPGFTSAMLRRILPSARLIGLDNAPASLASARDRLPEAAFILCDVSRPPLPVAVDVMYCRFLLSHLPDPVGVCNGWLSALKPGGCILIEEVESIQPGAEPLATYLDVTRGLIASGGGCLEVGPVLDSGRYQGCLVASKINRIEVPNATAAQWFIHNTHTVWPTHPYVTARVDEPARLGLLSALESLASSDNGGASVWHMRQVVLSLDMS